MRAASLLALWALPVCLALHSGTFLIWEQDIFWQLRAGSELLLSGRLPTADEWSYTSRGRAWINVQWLATVLFALAHRLLCRGADHFGPLILVRAAMIAGLLAQVGHVAALAADAYAATVAGAGADAAELRGPASPAAAGAEQRRAARGKAGRAGAPSATACAQLLASPRFRTARRWLCAWAAQGLFARAAAHRLQLRSETLAFCAFVAVWQAWLAPGLSTRARRLAAIGAVVLSGQLHAGTSPFAVGAAVCCALSLPTRAREPLARRLGWAALTGAAWLATPYHVRILRLQWVHLRYGAYNKLQNPDHEPLGAKAWQDGWPRALFALVGCAAVGGLGLLSSRRVRARAAQPAGAAPPFGGAPLQLCALGVLVGMTFDRVRCAPYAAAFAVPLATLALCWGADALALLGLRALSAAGALPAPARATGSGRDGAASGARAWRESRALLARAALVALAACAALALRRAGLLDLWPRAPPAQRGAAPLGAPGADPSPARARSRGELARAVLAEFGGDFPRLCAEAMLREPPTAAWLAAGLRRHGSAWLLEDAAQGVEAMWGPGEGGSEDGGKGGNRGILRGGPSGGNASAALGDGALPSACMRLAVARLPRAARLAARAARAWARLRQRVGGRGLNPASFPIGCVDFLREASGLARAGGDLRAANAALGWAPDAAKAAGVRASPAGPPLAPGAAPPWARRAAGDSFVEPNLYHGFTYGHYLTWNNPEFPVFADTREVMFHWLQERVTAAFRSPVELAANLRRWSARANLLPMPQTEYLPQLGGWRDLLAEYSPRERWALVCFDHVSVLQLERARRPHAAIVRAHEYKLLRPYLPPANFATRQRRGGEHAADDAARDAAYLTELERCRRAMPLHAWCRAAEGAWVRAAHGADARAVGRAVLLLQEVQPALVLSHQMAWVQQEHLELRRLELELLRRDAGMP